jgi:hypothetical protein
MMNTTLNRRALFAGAAALALALAAPPTAQAEPSRFAVVELFTSQGCSSCPPADALMGELVKRDDVIALSFNVDYWDYIGWKDSLAKPEFGARAKTYVERLRLQSQYTPQMVVDGAIDVAGNKRGKVEGIVEKQANGAPKRVSVAIARGANGVGVTIGEGQPLVGSARIIVLRTMSKVTVEIGKGENKGKSVTYYNAVRHMMDAGAWTGKAVTLSLPLVQPDLADKTDGLVVLVQDGPGGAILGAAQLKQ